MCRGFFLQKKRFRQAKTARLNRYINKGKRNSRLINAESGERVHEKET
jgi:hypothetical protein